MSKSFAQYFQNAYSKEGKSAYIRAHYDATGFCSAKIKGMQGNILSRIRNSLIEAVNKQILLPKVIIVIIEHDVLIDLNHYKPGVSEATGRLAEWLINQFHRIITSHKEKLPSKSRKFKFPTILWTKTVNHNAYSKRDQEVIDKWNEALEKAAGLFREMATLKLTGWNVGNFNYLAADGKMNNNGLFRFWQSVNDSFESWDREAMKNNRGQKQEQVPTMFSKKRTFLESCAQNDKYHWKAKDARFQLPKLH